jgi:ATP-dependent Lon protease
MTNDDAQAELLDSRDPEAGSGLALPDQVLPDVLHLIPVMSRPFFPAQVHPVVVDADPWQQTLHAVAENGGPPLAGLIYTPRLGDLDKVDDFPKIGCAVRLLNAAVEEGKIQFVCQGLQRFRIVQWLSKSPPYRVRVEYPRNPEEDAEQLKAFAMAIIGAIKELLPLNPLYNAELRHYLNRFSPNDPSPLADFAASLTTAPGDDLQGILETLPLQRRMEKVLLLLKKELDVARLQSKISEQVNEKISGQQREFFLREQLKVIQKELGLSKDDKTAESEEFQQRLEGKTVPAEAQRRIDEEMRKFSVLESGSPEYAVTRNYLDWLTVMPWGVHSKDKLDLQHAREVLNAHHDGLDDVKQRIVEFLALGAFKGEVSGSIMLLVGPPGVGKTSIGRSIADALGRKFYRFSVGGMRDEAEIKGHRRTYIGAMPGKFVQALKDVEVSNPVIMLDEIDKIGSSYQGDPASALLEALDPEQNSEFLDHYLDVRLDLSKALFVCTANQLDSIPGPLLDRMETIRLSGYIAEEKLAIARNHLWPRMLQQAGVKNSQLKITDAALRRVVDGYAREAGVRNLEKQLRKILRKAVVEILETDNNAVRVGVKNVEHYLGSPVFSKDAAIAGVGVVTGLAWTSMGGATLPIEATRVHTLNRGFKLTGQLGEVMQESAAIAYSYVVANLKRYHADEDFFNEAQVHLHVPAGATPKDGPSAGVTMATALLSLALQRKVGRGLAMTGELTLTGQVLPVGGIREKVIAARRAGLKQLILPAANQRDYDELPAYLKGGIKIDFAAHYSDVYAIALDMA